jgi:two-component sensor histidine kinase
MRIAILPRTTTILLTVILGLTHVMARTAIDDSTATAERLIHEAELLTDSAPSAAMTSLEQAIRFVPLPTQHKTRLQALRAKRDLELRYAAYDAALRTSREVIRASAATGDRLAFSDDLVQDAEALERTNAPDMAIDALQRALLMRRTTSDTVGILKVCIRLFEAYVAQGRSSECKRLYTERLKDVQDPVLRSKVQVLQGLALIGQGRSGDALPTLLKALHEMAPDASFEDRSAALFAAAEAEVGLGLWKDANAHWEEATTLLRDNRALFTTHTPFGLRSRIDEGLGDMHAALVAQRRQSALRDSLLDERRATHAASLQALYILDNDRHDLVALRDESRASTLLMTEERERLQHWSIAIGILLAVLAVLLFVGRSWRKSLLRERTKTLVIRRQSEEIRSKDLELGRQTLRLTETLNNEEQKDILLKEIHHRVKNNLQIAATLLRMQGSYSNETRYAELMRESEGRLRSMALVHEHLYKCGDLNRVNVKAHLLALTSGVLRSYDMEDRVVLDLHISYDRATFEELAPLSLMLNELLTNALKHAFKDRPKGRVTISLQRLDTDRCELIFTDDGVGMAGKDLMTCSSLGAELIRMLATQLNGSISLSGTGGTTFRMVFVPAECAWRKAS